MCSGENKMPMFDPKAMTFAQYIEDIYEIKAWGFDWNNEKSGIDFANWLVYQNVQRHSSRQQQGL